MFTTPAILLFWGTLLIVGGGYVLPINNVEERLQNGEYEDTASFKERLERIRSILFQEQEKVSQDDEVNDARRRLEKVGLILRQSYRDARNLFPAFLRDWHQAMKSVLTFILGSNYPYIALLDRKTVTRVKGNRFRKFFAGPGIILSGPDHVAAVWDGFKIRGIPRPGLAFTGAYEEIKESIDLRPQLRTLTVKATTKDGIPVSVFTFVPHRVDPHGRPGATRPEPEPGTSFPYSQASIVKVISQETVEYRREGQGPAQMEFREKGTWDTLVPRKAREILTNVLAEYTFDDLCAPFEMDRDPRTEIRNRFIEDLTETVAPWGIQVVGGGISNIIPPDEEAWTKDTVWRARIDNWRVSWEEEMLKELGYGKAEAMATSYRLKEKVYAKSISQINHALAQSDRPSELASNVLALRVADAIQDMLGDKLVKQCLPMDVIDTLDHLSKAVSGNGAEV
jgi:regulator of protease activity HflC (stomatin/prohibitin superfamily)